MMGDDYIVMRGVLNDENLYKLIDRVVDNKKQVTIGEPSPQVDKEVNGCTAFDGRVSDHIFDKVFMLMIL